MNEIWRKIRKEMRKYRKLPLLSCVFFLRYQNCNGDRQLIKKSIILVWQAVGELQLAVPARRLFRQPHGEGGAR